jgi:hypothetical protein
MCDQKPYIYIEKDEKLRDSNNYEKKFTICNAIKMMNKSAFRSMAKPAEIKWYKSTTR